MSKHAYSYKKISHVYPWFGSYIGQGNTFSKHSCMLLEQSIVKQKLFNRVYNWIWKMQFKQAGVELGLTQAETVSLDLKVIKGLTKTSWSCAEVNLKGETLDKEGPTHICWDSN